MNVLVIGRGGREHAIARKFSESKRVNTVFVAPGNPGMQDVSTLVPIAENEKEKLLAFAKDNEIGDLEGGVSVTIFALIPEKEYS